MLWGRKTVCLLSQVRKGIPGSCFPATSWSMGAELTSANQPKTCSPIPTALHNPGQPACQVLGSVHTMDSVGAFVYGIAVPASSSSFRSNVGFYYTTAESNSAQDKNAPLRIPTHGPPFGNPQGSSVSSRPRLITAQHGQERTTWLEYESHGLGSPGPSPA